MEPIDWSQVEIGESRFAEGKSVARCREYSRARAYGYKAGKRFRGRRLGLGVIEIWRVPFDERNKMEGTAGPWPHMEIGDYVDRPGRTAAECPDYQRAQMYGQRAGKRFSGRVISDEVVRITRVDDTVRVSHYPWCTMKVGESVDVEGNDAGSSLQAERARRYGHRNGKRFSGRTLGNGKIRITRVK